MPKKKGERQLLVVVACIVHSHPADASLGVKPRILLARRQEPEQKEIHLMWELPGGKVDFGETAERALLREVQEETGHQVEIVGLVPFSYATQWEYEGFRQHTVIYCYECRVREFAKGQASEDHKIRELRWFLFDEVDFSHVLPGSREFIWHIAKKHSIDLTDYEPKVAYATFTCVDPDRNKYSFYSISLQIDPAAERPYIVTARNKRLDYRGPGELRTHYFESDKEAREEILKRLKLRRQSGYAVDSYTDNFPFRDLLSTFPEPKSSSQQLSLL